MNIDRRNLLGILAATGIGTTTFHRAAVTLAQENSPVADSANIDKDVLKKAEWISGNALSDDEREKLIEAVRSNQRAINPLRKINLSAADPPAIHFETLGAQHDPTVVIERSVVPSETQAPPRPDGDDELAFMSVVQLSNLIRTGKLTSTELTQLYLARLKKYDPLLKFVVHDTEELALKTAAKADLEIASGLYRGPLHGIPWGAKDLISVPGYPTTWGISQRADTVSPLQATVYQRLDAAGAVLVAKLSLGALAMGDRWYGGQTKSPWAPAMGSEGSSAGSASATAAGCVGFSIGSETLGSILTPSKRCGTTGLRPTFGRVSRYGCMPLAWSMDKIGPITRTVEDAALVLAAIHGADGCDATAITKPFRWPKDVDFKSLTVGYVNPHPGAETNRADLKILRDIGVKIKEIQLPQSAAISAMPNIIAIEGAATFEEMLNRGDVESWNTWPDTFRAAQFVSAVDYLRLMRHRRRLMVEMESLMESVDVLVNANDLVLTNLTGHPSVVFPVGFFQHVKGRSPICTTLTGRLFDEARLLALAAEYQSRVTAHRQRPPLDQYLDEANP